LTVAPNGRHIFVYGGKTCSLLDVQTGKRIIQHNSRDVQGFGFLPEGNQFALAFYGEPQLQFYDTSTARQTDSLRHEGEERRELGAVFS
jgi:hypothetical protein